MIGFQLAAVLVVALVSNLAFIQHRPVVDEDIWLQHSETFAEALADRRWERTRTTTRPGVTVQWVIAGATLVSRDDTASRFAFASITVLCAAASFLLLRRLVSSRVALAAAVLIPLQPLLVTGSVAWTDLLLSWILLLAILLFVAASTFSPRQREYATIAVGILFGLAILTKIIGWLLPAMLLSTVATEKTWRTWLQRMTVPLTGIVLIGILTAFILYPAAWDKPALLLDRASEVTLTETPTASVTSGLAAYAGQFFSYDPVLLILTAMSLIGIITLYAQHNPAARTLSTFFLPAFVYAAALVSIATLSDSQVNQILSARYLVPITPLLTIGSLQFFDWLETHLRRPFFAVATSLLVISYAVLAAVSFGILL